MKIIDHIICWDLNSDKVDVFQWPDIHNQSAGYDRTDFACFPRIRMMASDKCGEMAFIVAMHMIVRDKVDPMAVHKAMLNFDVYRARCAADMGGKGHG